MRLKHYFYVLLTMVMASACSSAEEELKEQVREMAETSELGTIEATVKKIVKVNDSDWYKIGDRNILFSCTAYLKSGLDLSKLTEEDIQIDKKNNAVTLNLPAPQLLSLDLPSEETDLVYSHVTLFRSDFTVEERNAILQQGEKDIRSDYPNLGIVEETKESVTDLFTAFLVQMGYETITITFKENE